MNGKGDFENVLPRPLLAVGAKLDIMLWASQASWTGALGGAASKSGLIGVQNIGGERNLAIERDMIHCDLTLPSLWQYIL